jgi:methionine-rich copper-binding protein CopC
VSRRIVVALAATLALALPASAAAHTPIKSHSPKRGSTVSRSLSVVKVNFKGRISDANLTVRRGDDTVSRGDGRMARRNKQVRVRLESGLRAGGYSATVRWLSRDGHVLGKTWSFRVR